MRDERGSYTIEVAMMIPFVLFFVMAVVGFTFISYAKAAVTEAAREAAREAAVKYDLPGVDEIAEAKKAAAHVLRTGGLNPARAVVAVRLAGDRAEAEVRYPVPPFVPGLGRLLGGGRAFGMPAIQSKATAKLEKDVWR